jgi:hypothetical protein
MKGRETGWEIVSASVRGGSHIRNGLPNQDATSHRSLETPTGAVAAVADGHGGKRYVRSDRGSAFAVEIACDTVSEFLARYSDLRGDELLTTAREALVSPLVDRWRDTVRADLKREPLTPEEEQRSGQLHGEDLFLAYGATLLIAAVWDDTTLLLQLGDGDLNAVLRSGDVQRPVPEDHRLVAGETTSLGLPDAVESFRLAELPVSNRDTIELLMLCTDGYGNSFADPDWRHDVGADLLERARREGLDELGRALPAWLAESASAGGDDVTMALLYREGAADAAPAITAEQPAVSSAAAATDPGPPIVVAQPPPNRRGKGGIVGAIIAAVVALALGAAIGWIARGDDGTTIQEVAVEPEPTPETTATADSSPPTSSPTQAVSTEVVLVPNGIVTFRPGDEDDTPTFREERVTSPPTQVTANGTRWMIVDGRLVWSGTDGKQLPLRAAPTFTPAGITYADGKVWVASANGTKLTSCEPTEGTCETFGRDVDQP